VTVHSWSGIGIKDRLSLEDIEEIKEKAYVRNKILDSKVLIIDEISMLHHFRLDMIDRVLKHIKKNTEPFGGMQVILCGDFFQLPPVSRMGEMEAKFVYHSQSWKEGNFVICYLHENYRQNNDPILKILNELRDNNLSKESLKILKTRSAKNKEEEVEEVEYEEVIDMDSGQSAYDDLTTVLYTHNVDVDNINDQQLKKLGGLNVLYQMESKGKKPLVEILKKSCLAPENLYLKKGARVMCVKNNFEQGYVNGTLGVVVSCAPDSDPVIRTSVSPDYPEGRLITIQKAEWQIREDDKILAEIIQYPLRLAWAITVHKSQGMSLDSVTVDLAKAFEPGMGYVALSRVRTLTGLNILGMNKNSLEINLEVLEHDRELRELSRKAESVINYTDHSEIERSHKEFLAKVAPMHTIGKVKKKANTYVETVNLIKKNKSLKEIAKSRDLKDDTILGQLEHIYKDKNSMDEYDVVQNDLYYLKKEIPIAHFIKIEKVLSILSEEKKDEDPILLTAIKNQLGPNISFKEIRLARLILGYWTK
jgi:ATP-dependent exoDNAse (exonuclease V) alpha subunit